MRSILLLIAILANFPSAIASECTDFSGIYYIEGSIWPCEEIIQNNCNSQKIVGYGVSTVSVEFITDGIYRRYIMERNAQKAFSHNYDGTITYSALYDEGSEYLSNKNLLPNGNISGESLWWSSQSSSPEREEFIWVRYPSIESCLDFASNAIH